MTRLADESGALGRALRDGLDADRWLQRSMAATIELAKSRYALNAGAQWQPGQPLKLLLAGYSGTRNTGADVRVEEMIRQFRHLFGDDNLDLSLLTIDPALSRGYFRTVKQLHLPQFFPPFLLETIHQQHGVVACEGSMFKSKFANALCTMMVGALGLAQAEGKLCVGYGAEAGAMDNSIEALVRRYCQKTFVLARNEASRSILQDLGIQAVPGTDTAWTFEAAPAQTAERLLRDAGWDGRQRILALAPINAFWWPVKPDLRRGVERLLFGSHKRAHYKSLYFHRSGRDVDRQQEAYIRALGAAAARLCATRDLFPIVIGMEQLDRGACEALAESLPQPAPVFVSDEHDMYALVSVLRQAHLLLSSRYHAIVTSMPSQVLSVGVTMDERIRNLMADRGQPELALEVDDPDLAEKLYAAAEAVLENEAEVRDAIGSAVVRNLERMGEMGRDLVHHVYAYHPELPVRVDTRTRSALTYLPPLSPTLEGLVQQFAQPARRGLQGNRADDGRLNTERSEQGRRNGRNTATL